MRVTAAYRVGRSPDALAFDLGLGRLYVGSESGTVTVFAERAGRLVRLGAGVMPHAHAVAVDPRTYLVYLPPHADRGVDVDVWRRLPTSGLRDLPALAGWPGHRSAPMSQSKYEDG